MDSGTSSASNRADQPKSDESVSQEQVEEILDLVEVAPPKEDVLTRRG